MNPSSSPAFDSYDTSAPALGNAVDRTWSEVCRSLSERPRRLPCKLFYDARGSELFESITRQPEYYPTQAELAVLRAHAREISADLGPRAVIVEFGSGASIKTRVLLDELERPRLYVPIDISQSALMSGVGALEASYPGLEVRPVVGDYTAHLSLPLDRSELGDKVLAFFPGSTIGNFEPAEAVAFLRRVRQLCGSQQRFLVGVDVPKQRTVLEAAYDDECGVTAAFNRNILDVLNQRYGGDFDPEAFEHRALWNAAEGRVEMHLVSRRAQRARLGSLLVELGRGEVIVTEHCYKYHRREFRRLAEAADFCVARVWLDADERFSVHCLTPRAGHEVS